MMTPPCAFSISILFPVGVTLAERHWVTSGEHRRLALQRRFPSGSAPQQLTVPAGLLNKLADCVVQIFSLDRQNHILYNQL